ncbi:hypothetical protein [Arthrobacter agilis]|uniref:hypothetical protein n=1 Tax=Arthrobacter agilis TaxID=37921 RepID=UPI001ABFE439|nr:hypothetical protein [Arthrobacter agilis]
MPTDAITSSLSEVAVIASVMALVAGVLSAAVALITRRHQSKAEDAEIETLQEWRRVMDAWAGATAEAEGDGRRAEDMTGLERRFELLERRLTSMEGRLPERGTLDKLESVNDAILATQLENLSKHIDRLDQNAMTTGAVTQIVLTCIGALAAITALSTWVLGQLAS